jgi:hypothetical protein
MAKMVKRVKPLHAARISQLPDLGSLDGRDKDRLFDVLPPQRDPKRPRNRCPTAGKAVAKTKGRQVA